MEISVPMARASVLQRRNCGQSEAVPGRDAFTRFSSRHKILEGEIVEARCRSACRTIKAEAANLPDSTADLQSILRYVVLSVTRSSARSFPLQQSGGTDSPNQNPVMSRGVCSRYAQHMMILARAFLLT
jgi:hypothetical protein